MGSDVSTTTQNITDEINKQIKLKVTSDTTFPCNMNLGRVNTMNCNFQVEPLCSTNSIGTLSAVTDAAINLWNRATFAQRSALLPFFGVSFININQVNPNVIRNYLNQQCNTNTTLTNSIANGDINLSCSRPGTLVTLTNSGNATGNCAINTVINAGVYAVSAANRVNRRPMQLNLCNMLGLQRGCEYGVGGFASSVLSLMLFALCLMVIMFMGYR